MKSGDFAPKVHSLPLINNLFPLKHCAVSQLVRGYDETDTVPRLRLEDHYRIIFQFSRKFQRYTILRF